MDMREILALLFRARLKIAIAFLVPVLAAVGVFIVVPRTYEAEAQLLIRIGREKEARSEVGQQPADVPQATQQEAINSEMAILKSRDIAFTILKEFGTQTLFPRLDAAPDPDLPPADDAVRAFENALTVAPVANSSVFTVSYEAPSPALATKVLTRVLELQQQWHIKAIERPISSFLDKQLSDLEQTIEGFDAEAAKFKTATKIYDPAEERHELLNRRNELATTIAQSRSHTAELTKRVTELEDLRARTPEEIKMFAESKPSDAMYTSLFNLTMQLERARSDLLALRVQQQQQGNIAPDSSDTMVRLRERIDAVNKLFETEGAKSFDVVRTGRNPLYDELTAEKARAETEIGPEQASIVAQQQEVDRIDERLNAVEEGARTLDALRRKRDNLENALSGFRQRQAQAGMLEEMDKMRFVDTQMVEAPVPVTFDKPAHPKPLIFAAAGLAGGIVAAAFLLVFMFMVHNTYLTPEAVEASVDIPVLASVWVDRAAARG